MSKTKKKSMELLGSNAFRMSAGAALVALATASVVSCGGGGSGSSLPPGVGLVESAAPVMATAPLTTTEVDQILAQGADAAKQLGVDGVIAVVDRVGNVLGVYSTLNPTPAAPTVFPPAGNITITSNRGIANSGLDGVALPNSFAGYFAISKAVTGAYLSSSGNAFSTRTASLIVQEHFYPKEANTPAGPLFGVQFSQLPCGDLVRDVTQNLKAGPKRSPLGLSADPGGFPLYKNGVVVGGVGFISFSGTYSLDPEPRDTDNDPEEVIAWSATKGYEAPESIRGNRISAGGVFLLFSDTNGLSVSKTTLTSPGLSGGLISVDGYTSSSSIQPGIAYGVPESGYRPATSGDGLGGNLVDRGAFVLTDGTNANRYDPNILAPSAPANLNSSTVKTLLDKAYEIAFRGRAQIRFPTGSAIQVTISVVDTNGNVLGIVRTPDAPVFGTDVSLQKARSAMLMSSNVAAQIAATPELSAYKDVVNFTTLTKFDGSVAFSARGFGNFARPFFTDGADGTSNGPFSKPFAQWSPFSTGLQLDLSERPTFPFIAGSTGRNITRNIAATGPMRATTCAPNGLPAQNGLQIFPGGFPIYSGNTLVGGIGISGDGIDQDDMISFLGLENTRRTGASINHAPASIRIDKKAFDAGYSARYVQCPFKPFNDSDQTNPCEGI